MPLYTGGARPAVPPRRATPAARARPAGRVGPLSAAAEVDQTVGIAVALAGAASWAVSSALLASQSRRVDSLTASLLRLFVAVLFYIPVIFAFGAQTEFARMDAGDLIQLIASGILALALGETLYTAAIATIGLTRAFTTVIAVYNFSAFLLAAIFIGESVSVKIILGSLLVIAGVYVVVIYGRPRSQRPDSAAPATAHSQVEVRLPLLGRLTPRFGLGVALALLTGLVWGISAVWLRSAADGFDAAAVGAIRIPGAAAVVLLAVAVQPESSLRRRSFMGRPLVVLALSGVLANGLGSFAFVFALGEIGAGQTVLLYSTAPLIALPLGAIFLRESVTRWVVAGTLLAVAGIMLIA